MKPFYDDAQHGITIYQGDCREVLPCFQDKADLIFADPPFNAGKCYGSGRHNDNMPAAEYIRWLESVLEPLAAVLDEGGTLWLMNDTRWIGYCQVILDKLGLDFLNMIVWAYANPTPARSRFSKTWRPILLYARGTPSFFDSSAYPLQRPTLYFNPDRAKNSFCHDVWSDIPKLVGGFLAPDELLVDPSTGRFAHLAQMPVAIAERAIMTATRPGDLVFDPFMGSGTVLAAAKKLGRRAVGIELEEGYCSLAVNRLAQGVLL